MNKCDIMGFSIASRVITDEIWDNVEIGRKISSNRWENRIGPKSSTD